MALVKLLGAALLFGVLLTCALHRPIEHAVVAWSAPPVASPQVPSPSPQLTDAEMRAVRQLLTTPVPPTPPSTWQVDLELNGWSRTTLNCHVVQLGVLTCHD